MKKFLILLCFGLASVVQAAEFKTNLSSYSYMIAAEENPVQYHFSEDLIKAAENCTVYSEDFSKNNQELIKYQDMFGGPLFVFVNIKGKKDNRCLVDVNAQYGVLGHNLYRCQLSDEERQNFVEVIKNKANETVTETYNSFMTIKDETGRVLRKEPQSVTLTSHRFNIEWLKMLNQSCDILQDSFSEAEQLEQNFTLNELPYKFLASLKRCVPASTSRHLLALEIKGWVKGECQIETDDFTVYLAPEMTKKIKTWDNVYEVIRNEKLSHYHYQKDDYVSGLLLAVKACGDHKENYETVSIMSDEYLKFRRGMISQYSDEVCQLELVNQVSFDGEMRDFGKDCRLYPLDIQGILKKYSELLEKYKTLQSQEEKNVALDTEVGVDLIVADKEIMAYLNEHNFCRRHSLKITNP